MSQMSLASSVNKQVPWQACCMPSIHHSVVVWACNVMQLLLRRQRACHMWSHQALAVHFSDKHWHGERGTHFLLLVAAALLCGYAQPGGSRRRPVLAGERCKSRRLQKVAAPALLAAGDRLTRQQAACVGIHAKRHTNLRPVCCATCSGIITSSAAEQAGMALPVSHFSVRGLDRGSHQIHTSCMSQELAGGASPGGPAFGLLLLLPCEPSSALCCCASHSSVSARLGGGCPGTHAYSLCTPCSGSAQPSCRSCACAATAAFRDSMAEGPMPRLPHLKGGRALTAAEGTLNSRPAHTTPNKEEELKLCRESLFNYAYAHQMPCMAADCMNTALLIPRQSESLQMT